VEPIHERVAGMDVHRMEHVVTVQLAQKDGTILKETRQFGAFKRDMRALVDWLLSHRIQLVVMESTGIYWKSVFSHLEAAGIPALVVNAFHVKNVPGRKTDVSDSEWLAQLARFGLLRGSFIPPKDVRELRVVSRYRRKLAQTLAGEKNRIHKILDDAGIKLGGVVSDIDGVYARKMLEGLVAGRTPAELSALGRGKLKSSEEVLQASMEGDLSPRHRLVLTTAWNHLRYLEQQLAELDRYLIEAMQPYAWAWCLLQTIPGIDEISAALILIEIGIDMQQFGSASRLASWAALCPGNRESAGKRKSGKIRHGNPIVRYLLCEAANAARRTKTVFRAKYNDLSLPVASPITTRRWTTKP
jgi:transposase